MTHDQAKTLRMMMSQIAPPPAPESEAASVWTIPHKVVVIAGGRREVGTTMLAENLATVGEHRGLRTTVLGQDVLPSALDERPDFFLLDAGCSADFEGIADFLVLVTAPDREAVTGAYIALKRFRWSDPELPAGIVVNFARSPAEGAALAERIASAALSFIRGPRPEVLGWILEDHAAARSLPDAAPVVARSPRSTAASGIRLCARRLWARWRPRWSSAAA